jgi:lysophospholipase L1-like esterase
MTVICAFGTSTTYGAWDIEGGGWVNRLRRHLDETGSKDLIYNAGISGDTTKDVLERFDVECKARCKEAKAYKEPFVILFSVGGNDAYLLNGRVMVSKSAFRRNIRALITKASRYTKKIFFVEMHLVDESKTTPIPWNRKISYINRTTMEYNEILAEICDEKKVPLIRNTDKFTKNYKSMLSDGLHPSDKGHEEIYKAVKAFLIKKGLIT